MTTEEKFAELQDQIALHLIKIEKIAKNWNLPMTKQTIVLRDPNDPDMILIVTNESYEGLKEAFDQVFKNAKPVARPSTNQTNEVTRLTEKSVPVDARGGDPFPLYIVDEADALGGSSAFESKPVPTSKAKKWEFEVYGKKRVIRDVRDDKPNNFEAYYRNHFIRVFIDNDGWCYAICSAADGGRIVDGYIKVPEREGSLIMKNGSIEDGVRECLENIFYEPKEASA